MTINPDALYLLERSGQCYKVKSSDIASVGQAGDLLFCNKAEEPGKSYKVEYSKWDTIPDNALMLVNLNNDSYSVTGAQFKEGQGPPPLPEGARYVGFSGSNEVGYSYQAVNNNTGDSYGTSGAGGGEARMYIELRINNQNQWWSVGDVFVFYWRPSGSYSARAEASPAAIDRNSVDQRIGTGWGYSGVDTPFTIIGDEGSVVPMVKFYLTGGTGTMAFASTKVNGIVAGTGAGSGSLPGFRSTKSIMNEEGKILMAPKIQWIYPDGTLIYPELQLANTLSEAGKLKQEGLSAEVNEMAESLLVPENLEHTWMEPGYGTERTDVVGEIAEIEPTVKGAVIPEP